jgi:hypothetical protein
VLVRLTGGDEVIPGDVAELIDSQRGDLVGGQHDHGTISPGDHRQPASEGPG